MTLYFYFRSQSRITNIFQMKLGINDSESLRKKLLELVAKLDFKKLGNDVRSFLFNAGDVRKVELFPGFIAQTPLE